MKIEPLKKEDIPALCEIERVCFGATAWSEESFFSEMQNPSSLCLVALDADSPIGCIAANLSEEAAFISKVMVIPNQRRKGVARVLLHTLCAMAKQRGLIEVTLEVRASNEAAIALYDATGFISLGKRRNFYRFPKEDAVIMTRNL